MAGVTVLADKKHKFTILTTKPVNEAAPTVAELNAGIQACLKVKADGFKFSAADSDVVSSTALCGSKAEVYTDSNYVLDFTLWRYYLVAGGIDVTDDALFAAVKTRGTTLWAYARLTDKAASLAWVAAEEIYLGAKFTTDTPQVPDNPGWVEFRIPCKVQDGWPFIVVAA